MSTGYFKKRLNASPKCVQQHDLHDPGLCPHCLLPSSTALGLGFIGSPCAKRKFTVILKLCFLFFILVLNSRLMGSLVYRMALRDERHRALGVVVGKGSLGLACECYCCVPVAVLVVEGPTLSDSPTKLRTGLLNSRCE